MALKCLASWFALIYPCARLAHQPLDGAARYPNAFTVHLQPDFVGTIDLPVGMPDTLHVRPCAARLAWRGDCATQDCTCALRGASNTTGPSAAPCRWTRPRRCHGAGPRIVSVLQTAVELRLGKNRAGQLEDFIGLAQLAILTFEFLQYSDAQWT